MDPKFREWTSEELHQILAREVSDAELARRIGRTKRAIAQKRYLVGGGWILKKQYKEDQKWK